MTTYIINSDNYQNFNGIFSLEDKKVIYNFTQSTNDDFEDDTTYYYLLFDGSFLIIRYRFVYIISKAGNLINKFTIEPYPSVNIRDSNVLYTAGNGYLDFHMIDIDYNAKQSISTLANNILSIDYTLPEDKTTLVPNLVARWDYGVEALEPVYIGNYTFDLSALETYRGRLYSSSIEFKRVSTTEFRVLIPVSYTYNTNPATSDPFEMVFKIVLDNTNRTGTFVHLYNTIKNIGGIYTTYGMESDPATYVAKHDIWDSTDLNNIWDIKEQPAYSVDSWKAGRAILLSRSEASLGSASPYYDSYYNVYRYSGGASQYREDINERNLTFEYDQETFTLTLYNMKESRLRPISTFTIPVEYRVGFNNYDAYRIQTLFCSTRNRFICYNNSAYLILSIRKYENEYSAIGEVSISLLLKFNGNTGALSIVKVLSFTKATQNDYDPIALTGLASFPNITKNSFEGLGVSYIGNGNIVFESINCRRPEGPNYRAWNDTTALVFNLNTYTFTASLNDVTLPEFTLENRWSVLNISNIYTISGTVTDGGSVVPNATVNLINNQGCVLKDTVTNQSGVYSFTTFDNTPMTVLVSSPNSARKVQTHLVTPTLVGPNNTTSQVMEELAVQNVLSGQDPGPRVTVPPPPLSIYSSRTWDTVKDPVISAPHYQYRSWLITDRSNLRVNRYTNMEDPAYTFIAKSHNDRYHLFIYNTTTLIMLEKIAGRVLLDNVIGYLTGIGSWIAHGAYVSDDGNRVLIPERSHQANGPGNSYPQTAEGTSFICYYRASGTNYTGPTAFNKLGGQVFPGQTYRGAATFSHNNWNYDRITFVSGYFTTSGWPGGEFPSVKIEYNFDAQQGTWVQDPASFVQLMRTSEDAANRYFASGSYVYTYTHWVQFIPVEGPEHEGIFLKDVYEDWVHKTTLVQTVYRYRCYSTWDTELTARIQYLNGDLEWARAAVTPVPADPPYNNDSRYNLGLFIGHWSPYYGGSSTNITKDTIIKHWQDPVLWEDYEFMFIDRTTNNHGGMFPKKDVYVYRHPNRINYMYIDMHKINCQFFGVPLNISSAEQLPVGARYYYGTPRGVYDQEDLVNGRMLPLINQTILPGSRIAISPSGNKMFMVADLQNGQGYRRFNWGVDYMSYVIFELTRSGNEFNYTRHIVTDSFNSYAEFLALPESSRAFGYITSINVFSDTEIEFCSGHEQYTGNGYAYYSKSIRATLK